MASVSKRKWTSPDGTAKEAWIVRYKDAGGSHRQSTFDRKKDADAFRLKAENELARGVHVATSRSKTINELIDAYLEQVAERAREGRRMSYEHSKSINMFMRVHVRPHIGAVKLCDFTFAVAEEWARKLMNGGRLSPRSARHVLALFKVVIDYAIRREWIFTANVVSQVMGEYRGIQREPIRTFTKEEVRALLLAAAERRPYQTERAALMLRCAVYLAAFCGLRYGEVMGLRLDHIDFARGVIEVRHSLTQEDNLKGPKTKAGIRDVPMPRIVAEALKEWIERFYVVNDRCLAFRRRCGSFFTAQAFHTNHWRKLLERNGLGPDKNGRSFHFHALRHFCASMMISEGMPVTDVAELMGHSSFDMTLQVYAHALMVSDRRADLLEGVATALFAAPALPAPTAPAMALAA